MTSIDEQRSSASSLADALRCLTQAMVATEVSPVVMAGVEASVRELTTILRSETRAAGLASAMDDFKASNRAHNPVRGYAHPSSIQMVVEPRQGRSPATTLRFELGIEHEGHVGIAHGGITAMLFDEVFGIAATRQAWPSVTRDLTIEYRRPVLTCVPLVLHADVSRSVDRTAHVEGSLFNATEPEVTLVRGRATFIQLNAHQASRVLPGHRRSH
ncbi:PaaI family thioesterase [uncultured Jatrophihabitans sp.]|uniref:PaaI family thioesterase n=1 Tax=uncultured Jatrophihabitans sp. TaxID=1610747 RepID=UPI0035C9CADC